MARKELVDYIESEVKKGLHVSSVKKALLDVGHELHAVEEAILHVQKKHKHHGHYVRYVIPIFLMFILIIFAIILRETDPTATEKILDEVKDTLEGIGETATLPKTDSDLLDGAILNRDISLCDKIESTSLKESCINTLSPNEEVETLPETDSDFLDQAILNRNASLCNQIEDSALKSRCLDIVS